MLPVSVSVRGVLAVSSSCLVCCAADSFSVPVPVVLLEEESFAGDSSSYSADELVAPSLSVSSTCSVGFTGLPVPVSITGVLVASSSCSVYDAADSFSVPVPVVLLEE